MCLIDYCKSWGDIFKVNYYMLVKVLGPLWKQILSIRTELTRMENLPDVSDCQLP